MKQTFKILTSLALAVSMMLSSLAAPVLVGSVGTTEEAAGPATAGTAAELAADELVLLKEWNFDKDSDNEGWSIVSGTEYSGAVEDGYYAIWALVSGKKDNRIQNLDLNYSVSDISAIEISFNTQKIGTSLAMHYAANGVGITGTERLVYNYTPTDEWVKVTFDMTSANTDLTSNWAGKLTGLRFAITGTTDEENAVYVDYIKIYGKSGTTPPVEPEEPEEDPDDLTGLPGINILTGTADALNFDNLPDQTLSWKSGANTPLYNAQGNEILAFKNIPNLSIVESPISSEDGKVVKLHGIGEGTAKIYPQIHFSNYNAPTDGRPVFVSYDMFIWNADDWNTKESYYNWVISKDNTNTGSKFNMAKVYLSTETPVWQKTGYMDKNSNTAGLAYIQASYAPKDGESMKAGEMACEFYYDNIVYAPYYKVTFMNGTAKLGETWVLDDGNGNMLTSFDPTNYDDDITMPEGKNAWSLTPDGKAAKNVELNNEDIVLYAVTALNYTPGESIYTVDFQEGSMDGTKFMLNGTKMFDVSGGSGVIVDSPVKGDAGNKVLKFSGFTATSTETAYKSAYPQIVNLAGTLPIDNRPLYVAAHYMVHNAENLFVARGRVARNNNTNGSDAYVGNVGEGLIITSSFMSDETPDSWYHFGVKDDVSTTAMPRYVLTFTADKGNKTIAPTLYVDNMTVTPYYKVTYMDGDTMLGEAYVLDNGVGDILTSFNPEDYDDNIAMPAGKNAWSLTKGGEATLDIELNNEDIVVYATKRLNFAPGRNILTNTEKALDFEEAFAVSDHAFAIVSQNGVKRFELSTGKGAIVDSPVAGDSGKVLKWNGFTATESGVYPIARYFVGQLPEDGRPIFVGASAVVMNGDDLGTKADTASFRVGANSATSVYAAGSNTKIDVYTSSQVPTKWFKYGIKDATSTTALPCFVLTFKAKAGVTATPDLYLDNIYMTPYYKVTFMNGDTVLSEEWVLDDGAGNILDVFEPTRVFKGTYPEGTNAWSLTKGGEAVEVVALENKDIVVYATYAANFKPGVNLLTGTEDAFDFSTGRVSDNNLGYLTATGKSVINVKQYANLLELVDSPVGTAGDKSIKVSDFMFYGKPEATSASSYPTITSPIALPQDGRPVFASVNAVYTNADKITRTQVRYGLNGGNSSFVADGGLTYINVNSYPSTATQKEWSKLFVKDDKSTTNLTAFVFNFTMDVNYLDNTLNSNGENTNNWTVKADVLSPELYIDDVMYVPYYKVTYMDGDEVISTAWVLDDGNGNILTEFDPCETFTGTYPEGTNSWSLTKDGEEATSIALENKDIVVYAIHVDKAPETKDNIVWAIEYDNEFDLTKTNSAHSYARSGYVAIENGNLVVAANEPTLNEDGSIKGWDSLIGFPEFDINCSAVKKLEVRFKLTDVAEIKKTEDGKFVYDDASYVGTTPLTQAQLKDLYVEFFYTTDTYRPQASYHGTYNSGRSNFSGLVPDEEGYYTVTYDTSGFNGWDTTITALRFDIPSLPCTIYVDYFRMYGDEENFAPAASAPEKREGYSLRVDNPETTGIRLRAAINNRVREDKNLSEYGWIVALADTLGGEELTHNFESISGKKSYVTGKAYLKGSFDKIYETEDQYTVFTAVIVGVPAEQANKYLVIRPYSLIGDAYVYGETRTVSPREVAQKIYDKWVEEGKPDNHDYVKYQEYIDSLGITK